METKSVPLQHADSLGTWGTQVQTGCPAGWPASSRRAGHVWHALVSLAGLTLQVRSAGSCPVIEPIVINGSDCVSVGEATRRFMASWL